MRIGKKKTAVFSYRVGRLPQGRFGRRFSLCDLSAGFGDLGNEATAACGREREPNEWPWSKSAARKRATADFGYRNRRILCCEPWFMLLYLGFLGQCVSPSDFLFLGDFPGNLAENWDGGCCGEPN